MALTIIGKYKTLKTNGISSIRPILDNSTVSIPNAIQYQQYTSTDIVIKNAHTFAAITDLSTLGLTLSSGTGYCKFVGTPLVLGSFPITINASSGNDNANYTISLNVVPDPAIAPPQWVTNNIDSANENSYYTSNQLQANYADTFTQTNGVDITTLGLTLNSYTGYCEIVGTPTDIGSFNITLTAANSTNPGTDDNIFSLVINPVQPIWVTTTLSVKAFQSTPYDSGQLLVTNGVDFTQVSGDDLGNLGLTLISNLGYCEITGTPNNYGLNHITLQASNGSATANQSFKLMIYPSSSIVPDPFWTNVTCYLPLNNDVLDNSDNNSQNGLSITNHNVTFSNTTFNNYPYSAYFDGTTSYIQGPTSNATKFSGNFTIEGWFYPIIGVVGVLFDTKQTVNSFLGVRLYMEVNGAISLHSNAIFATNTVMPSNQWNHVALVRYGVVYLIYLNGKLIGNAAASTVVNLSDGNLCIGGNSSGNYYKGYMSEIRVTNGINKYGSNFDLPTQFSTIADLNADPFLNKTNTILTFENSNLADTSQNNEVWTATGTPVYSTNSYSGTHSLQLDGSSYITASSDIIFGTGDFTVEGMFNFTSLSSSAELWSKGSLSLSTIVSDLRSENLITVSSGLIVNTWFHIALVRSGSTTIIFVNGIEKSRLTFSENYNSTDPFYIGRYLNGYIDSFRISKCARYTSDFIVFDFATVLPTIYDPFYTDTSLLLHFDNNTNDSSGNMLSMTGTMLYTATAKYGGYAANFYNSYYLMYSAISDTTRFSADFTVECWVYPTTLNTSQYSPIIDCRLSGGTTHGFTLYIYSNKFVIFTGGVNVTWSSGSIYAGTVVSGQWKHVALVRHGSIISLYYDGSFVASIQNSNNFNDGNLFIGRFIDSGHFFGGLIDDYRITKTSRYTGNYIPTGPCISDPVWVTSSLIHAPQFVPYNTGHIVATYSDSFVQSGGTDLSTIGLTLTSHVGYCEIMGTVTSVGTTSITLDAINTHGDTEKTYSIIVDPAVPIWVTKTLSQQPTQNSFYDSGNITATYATSFIQNAGTKLSTLGLTLQSNNGYCKIVGTPITNGYYCVGFRALNSTVYSYQSFCFTIYSPQVTWTTSPLTLNATEYNSCNFNITATNAVSFTCRIYEWAVHPSILDNYNLTIVSHTGYCNIVGTPTNYTTNPVQVVVKAYNSANVIYPATFTLMVSAAAPTWTTTSLPNPMQFSSYNSGQILATNSKMFSIDGATSVALSTLGLTFSNHNTYCNISGSYPSVAGSNSITINAYNATTISSQILPLVIDYATPVWNSITTLPRAVVGNLYCSGKLYASKCKSFSQVVGSDTDISTIGLTINNYFGYCTITGNPTTNGTYNITLRATNGSHNVDQICTMIINTLTAVDPFFNNVSMLLPLSDDFVDYSGNTLDITNNNVVLDNTLSKFGNASAKFNGTDSYLLVTNPGNSSVITSDITIEFWIYPTRFAVPTAQIIFDTRANDGNAHGMYSYINRAGYVAIGSLGNVETLSSIPLNLNSWNHVVIYRQGSAIYNIFEVQCFINGVHTMGGQKWVSSTLTDQNFIIGRLPLIHVNATILPFQGNICNFRVTNGHSRYSAATYPVPTDKFAVKTETVGDPLWNYTTLLLNFDNFTDSSSYINTIINNGVALDTTIYKIDTSSAKFNGTNSYLTISPNNLFKFSGDFTLECWVNPVSNGTIYDGRVANTSATGLIINVSNSTFTINNGSSPTPFITSSVISFNNWYHIAIVRSGTNLVLYINGIFVVSKLVNTNFSDGHMIIGANCQTQNFFSGNIDQFRITKFARYTSNFVVPNSAVQTSMPSYDPFWFNTTALFHLDDNVDISNGNNSLVLTKGVYYYGNGINATISDTGKFNKSLMLHTGSFAKANVEFHVGTQNGWTAAVHNFMFYRDFTIEFFVNNTSNVSGTWRTFFSTRINDNSAVNTLGIWIGLYSGSNKLTVAHSSPIINTNSTLTVNTWYHIALVRNGLDLILYLNGVQVGSVPINYVFDAWYCYIGADSIAYGYYAANSAYIDELRITKSARYLNNFTPPAAPYSSGPGYTY